MQREGQSEGQAALTQIEQRGLNEQIINHMGIKNRYLARLSWEAPGKCVAKRKVANQGETRSSRERGYGEGGSFQDHSCVPGSRSNQRVRREVGAGRAQVRSGWRDGEGKVSL